MTAKYYTFECEQCPGTRFEVLSHVPLNNVRCPICTNGVQHKGETHGSYGLQHGIARIEAERRRQIESEGFGEEHDDTYHNDQMAWAAACYAAPSEIYAREETGPGQTLFYDPWPWDKSWDKRDRDQANMIEYVDPKRRIRALAKAGALIAAEIDLIVRRNPGYIQTMISFEKPYDTGFFQPGKETVIGYVFEGVQVNRETFFASLNTDAKRQEWRDHENELVENHGYVRGL